MLGCLAAMLGVLLFVTSSVIFVPLLLELNTNPPALLDKGVSPKRRFLFSILGGLLLGPISLLWCFLPIRLLDLSNSWQFVGWGVVGVSVLGACIWGGATFFETLCPHCFKPFSVILREIPKHTSQEVAPLASIETVTNVSHYHCLACQRDWQTEGSSKIWREVDYPGPNWKPPKQETPSSPAPTNGSTAPEPIAPADTASPRISTRALLAGRVLKHPPGAEWVTWANQMLATHETSLSLAILASETLPLNPFRLNELIAKTLEELKIDLTDAEKVIRAYAAELVEDLLMHRQSPATIEKALSILYAEAGHPPDLYTVYMLVENHCNANTTPTKRAEIELHLRTWLDTIQH